MFFKFNPWFSSIEPRPYRARRTIKGSLARSARSAIVVLVLAMNLLRLLTLLKRAISLVSIVFFISASFNPWLIDQRYTYLFTIQCLVTNNIDLYLSMHKVINEPGYWPLADFAKIYVRTKGKKKGAPGVTRGYISQLVKQEIAEPGSTDIDVLEVSGVCFARLRPTSQGSLQV